MIGFALYSVRGRVCLCTARCMRVCVCFEVTATEKYIQVEMKMKTFRAFLMRAI